MEPIDTKHVLWLSRDFIHHQWNGEADWCCDHVADNFLWVGVFTEQRKHDVEGFRRTCNRIEQSGVKIIFVNESFNIASSTKDMCCVFGTCLCYSGLGSNLVTSQPFRFTLLWQLDDEGEPKLVHLHTSIPTKDFAGINEGNYPEVAETLVNPPVQPTKNPEAPMHLFRDTHGITYFIAENEVMYVEAEGRNSLLHCYTKTIRIGEGISSVQEKFGPSFVRLHRSYLINALYVDKISGKGAVMSDGSILPVPARRLSDLKKAIFSARESIE